MDPDRPRVLMTAAVYGMAPANLPFTFGVQSVPPTPQPPPIPEWPPLPPIKTFPLASLLELTPENLSVEPSTNLIVAVTAENANRLGELARFIFDERLVEMNVAFDLVEAETEDG